MFLSENKLLFYDSWLKVIVIYSLIYKRKINLFMLLEINYIAFLSSDMKIYDCNDGLSALINIRFL